MTLIRQGKRVILPFDNFTSFPPTGNSNNFYFDSASGTMYYWDGTNYVSLGGCCCTQKSKSETVTIGCDTVTGVTDNNDGTYTWVHNLNIIDLNNVMFTPYPVISSTANSVTFKTAECVGEFKVSLLTFGADDCVSDTPVVPPASKYMLPPVPYKFNIDLKNAYQKPTDLEFETYDATVLAQDDTFRALRDVHSNTVVNYVVLSYIKGEILPTTSVSCMPNNTGVYTSKAKFIDLHIPEGIKTSYYGFPYDMLYKTQVATLTDLPLLGEAGDIRFVESESSYYYWHRSTNTWENDGVQLVETVGGVTMDVEDFMSTNRAMRDTYLRDVNSLFFGINQLRYVDDYLPSFQINKYKI